MSFDESALLQRLTELEDIAGKPSRLVIAFSGGLDSSVLLHALARSISEHGREIFAVHIDHGLHADSAMWSQHCERVADELGIAFETRRVGVCAASGQGPEAAAREARYRALADTLQPGDWLLSAHHQDDQAETVLLNLMRGSGPAGLAGIPSARRLAAGWLVRPLLDVALSDLQAYAQAQELDYITDPSNTDLQFDRNFLRHEILTRLESRWPDAGGRIRRSARLAREATELIVALAEIDRGQFADRHDRLSVVELAKLPKPRQRNLLRYLILELGLPSPGAAHLEQIVDELIPAREDAQPLVAWPGATARRYRDRLYLIAADETGDDGNASRTIAAGRTRLPGGLGVLELIAGAESGLSDAVVARGLELRTRVGGEEILLPGQLHTKKLKKLLQEAGVVPWMRERLPLLYSGGELVAVADLWIAAHAEAHPGTSIVWKERPPLH